MNMELFPHGPADHNSIIMWGEWTAVMNYNDQATPIPVIASGYPAPSPPNAPIVRFIWGVDRDRIPAEATHACLRIKLKAHVPNAAGQGYCQADVRVVIPDVVSNHLIHCEEWGRGPGNSGEGRRVTYQSINLPIIDEKLTLDVAHGIYYRSACIEFVAYLEGYLAP